MGAASIVKTIAKWLDEGYPEEVAKRIASGELPMDEASKAARAAEQGYGPVLYRGHHKDMPPTSDQDMWMSSSENVAETYADSRTMPFMTPLRTNASNMADVNARGRGWRHVRTTNRTVPGIETGVHQGTDTIAEVVKDSGQYDGTLFRDIKDEAVRSRGAEKADAYNVLGSRPDVNIRHADAAFDPQYKGSNIMGNATVPLLGLLTSGSAGMGVLLNSLFAEAERAK